MLISAAQTAMMPSAQNHSLSRGICSCSYALQRRIVRAFAGGIVRTLYLVRGGKKQKLQKCWDYRNIYDGAPTRNVAQKIQSRPRSIRARAACTPPNEADYGVT